MKCRHCNTPLSLQFVDLGSSPPSNAYLTEEKLTTPEKWFPLRVLACDRCWLVQTEDFTQADELFDAEYAYFSSFSSTWLALSSTRCGLLAMETAGASASRARQAHCSSRFTASPA